MAHSKIHKKGRYPYFYALQAFLKDARRYFPAKVQEGLGYFGAAKFETALEKFLDCREPYEWLCSGHYDFTHSALSFLEKCADFVKNGDLGEYNSVAEFQAEIARAFKDTKRYADWVLSRWVHVQTDFPFNAQTLAMLGLASGTCFELEKIPDSWVEKGVDYALKKDIPAILREHFESHGGVIPYPFKSKILGYAITFKTGDTERQVFFDTNGNVTEKPHKNTTNFFCF